MRKAQFIVLLLVCCVTTVLAAAAAPLVVDADAPATEVLRTLKGKRALVTLSGGTQLEGKVAAVGGQTLHLEQVVGKEFYDAAVRLDSIVAVSYRARE